MDQFSMKMTGILCYCSCSEMFLLQYVPEVLGRCRSTKQVSICWGTEVAVKSSVQYAQQQWI